MKLRLLAAIYLGSLSNLFSQVVMTTNIPTKLPVGSDVEFEVKINKGSIANFTKYHMDVPAGMEISEVDSKTGNFTFENNRAKIVWVSVPGEPEFIVKMKAHINTQAPFQGTINQKFYFLDGGVKKEVEATPITIEFGNGTPVNTAANINAAPKNLSGSTIQNTGGNTTANNTTTQPVSTTPVAPKTEPKSVPTATVPSLTQGLTYRVQIASSPNDPGKSKYASLGSAFKIVKEDGAFKVQYGDYATKDEALKAKSELSAKGYEGFLVKYQDGVRVK